MYSSKVMGENGACAALELRSSRATGRTRSIFDSRPWERPSGFEAHD